MIYHLFGHTAIDTDVLTRDETSLVGAEIEHHIGDVQWVADTSCRLLTGIRTFIDGVGSVNSARRDAVHTHPARQADGQGMGQRSYAPLCCRITLCLWLAHTVS